MHCEYEISEQDFLNAQRLAGRNSPVRSIRWSYTGMPLLGTILLAGWIGIAVIRGVSSHWLAVLIFPSLFLLSPWFHKWNAKSTYAKATSFHGPLQLDADDNGLLFRGAAFGGKIGWPSFSSFFEDEDGFVLYQKTGVFNVVPKRQLSPEQVAGLREYFERKIKDPNRT
jgi:hypothetical protein